MFRLKDKSCLAILMRMLLILVVLFVLGNGYAALRMEWARVKVYRLAYQLGYTPAHHLGEVFSSRDANLVTGTAIRVIELYFTTPLTVEAFEKHLKEIDSSPLKNDFIQKDKKILRWFMVNGVQGRDLEEDDLKWSVSMHDWIIPYKSRRYFFYETGKTNYRLEYDGQHITNNVIEISMDGATIPVWMSFGIRLWSQLHGHSFW